MAGSFEVNGSMIRIHFEYNAGSLTAINVIGNTASLLYTRNFPQDFTLNALSALTNNQKLNIVDAYVKRTVVNLAKQNAEETRMEIARRDAIDAGSVLDL